MVETMTYRPHVKDNTVAKIDRAARRLGITRNKFIDEAVLEKIDPRFIGLHRLEKQLWADLMKRRK